MIYKFYFLLTAGFAAWCYTNEQWPGLVIWLLLGIESVANLTHQQIKAKNNGGL